MAGMSVDGLVSGMDTTTLINSLLQVEAAPQTALKTRLSSTQDAAKAYRSINTKVDALRTAAENLTKPETWASAKATSSQPSVAVAMGTSPQTGSLTFSVKQTAATHSMVSTGRWPSTTDPNVFTSFAFTAGGTATTIPVGGTGSLNDAVAAINASKKGLKAAAVNVGNGQYALQVTAAASGVAGKFDVTSAGSTFATTTEAADADLLVGTTDNAYHVTSSTNTFTGLLPGATITVSKAEPAVTIDVVADPDAVAAKVQAFVDAANSALTEITKYTNSTGGATAVLKADTTLTSLAGQILDAVSDAVGTADVTGVVGTSGSPGAAGVQLTRDGKVTFDKTKFLAKLRENPALAQRLLNGTPTTAAFDTAGVAQRLQTLATNATKARTGTLTLLAQGQDDLAKNIQKRIDDWDVRLAARKDTLSRQFTAMETALSSMKQQSSWLAGQIASLPSSS
jgi:flagellar hook-associated protein 2